MSRGRCRAGRTSGTTAGRAPGIIRDGLDDMQSLVDGKRYTSKRAYYASLRAHGNLEIDDRPRMRDANRPDGRSDVWRDINRAMETLS